MPPAGLIRPTLLACAFALAGCNLDQEGRDPTVATLNFPIALGLAPSAGPSPYLFVANSNFDLRFNTATLQSFRLDDLHAAIAAECADGPCTFEDPGRFMASEVAIGSHASGIALSPSGRRIYLSVRARRNLTWIDIDDAGQLSCGQSGGPIPECDEAHERGSEGGVASERGLSLTNDPVAVGVVSLASLGAADESGDAVLMPTRDGNVALFVERAGVPELVHIAEGFPENVVTLTMQPNEAGVGWMTNATQAVLARVAIVLDPLDPARSFAFDFGSIPINTLDDGRDTRDLAFDPAGEVAYVLSRRPESVLAVDVDRRTANGGAAIGDVFEVGAGPSRLAFAAIGGRRYAIASCYEAARLFVVDLDYGELTSVVGGLSGPFDVVVDEARQVLYLADFSVSVVRVIDLAPLAAGQPPRVIATLGEPRAVRNFADQ